jgi:hypothetical protein
MIICSAVLQLLHEHTQTSRSYTLSDAVINVRHALNGTPRDILCVQRSRRYGDSVRLCVGIASSIFLMMTYHYPSHYPVMTCSEMF